MRVASRPACRWRISGDPTRLVTHAVPSRVQFYMKRLAAPAHNRRGIRVIRPAAVTVGKYSHRILREIGRNVPQEAPQMFAKAVLDVASSSS